MSDIEETTETTTPCTNGINLRLGKCEVCNVETAKYTCPKCEVKSCCLQCLNIHKKELNCDGMRDRTKFIRTKEMTKMDYMSDYYFLEECTRFVETRKSDKIKSIASCTKSLSSNLSKLRAAAQKRNVNLKILLNNFTRRKENSTFYDYKREIIFWRVQWVFRGAEHLQLVDKRCDENLKLSEVLEKYLLVDGDARKHLEKYQSKGASELKLFLKAEGVLKCKNRFYLLDCDKSLKDNLTGKTLVEFPCIHVAIGDVKEFELIENESEIQKQTAEHFANLKRLHESQLEKTTNPENEEEKDDLKELEKVLEERKREEKFAKRQKFENEPSNYLFSDDKLLDLLSSSDSENE